MKEHHKRILKTKKLIKKFILKIFLSKEPNKKIFLSNSLLYLLYFLISSKFLYLFIELE